MSEEFKESVLKKLQEEQWTRTTITNYTNLEELEKIVQEAKEQGCTDEIKAICDEHLSHSKDSIIALYVSGILGVKKSSLDNTVLQTLVGIFLNNHKEALVESLCKTILEEDDTNAFALRTLISCYRENKDADNKIWETYEKLVKVDSEEAEAAKILADHYKELKNDELAKEFYKKALLRYVYIKNYIAVKDVWEILVKLIPEDIDFFYLVQRKIAKTISADKSATLMKDVYNYYKDKAKWDTAIEILKLILSIDPKDNWSRKEITTCYESKYKGHSHVEEYIRDAGFSYRNVFDAISDFEKHIAFDEGHFVFHNTWHVGLIRKVENDMLVINFGKKNGIHKMSLKMAVDALIPLSNEHIWVIKATTKSKDGGFSTKAEMVDKIKKDKAWTLKTIIRSFNNSCDIKKIKAELVPSILTASEWTAWNSAAKKVLESDSTFGVNPNNSNEWTVRDREITPEEKLSNEFKAQKQFFPRVDILMKFCNNDLDKTSELFVDMRDYFTGYLKSYINMGDTKDISEQLMASYLITRRVYPQFIEQNADSVNFEKLYRQIEDPRKMYTSLKDTKNTSLKEDFLKNVGELSDWVQQYIRIFPAVLSKGMLTTLVDKGHKDEVQKLAQTAFDDFKGYRDLIYFFFDECRTDEWFTEINIPLQKQLIALVNIISQAYKAIDNHVDSTENKKIIANICKLIFNTGKKKDDDGSSIYAQYMLGSDKETMTHMYTIVDDIAELDDLIKAQLRSRILEKYPDFKFHKAEEKTTTPKGMLVTKRKLDEKRALEERMNSVDLPKIAKEVAEAKEKGDLKENAEYIAAKEAQHKLGLDLKRLQEELARAVIFDPTTATASIVSFGTDIVLENKDTGAEEKYTILGPWESEPENGIISYMSPFGMNLMEHKLGETLSFTINEHKYQYVIKNIAINTALTKF